MSSFLFSIPCCTFDIFFYALFLFLQFFLSFFLSLSNRIHYVNSLPGDNPFYSNIDSMPDIRPRRKSIPLVSELVRSVGQVFGFYFLIGSHLSCRHPSLMYTVYYFLLLLSSSSKVLSRRGNHDDDNNVLLLILFSRDTFVLIFWYLILFGYGR